MRTRAEAQTAPVVAEVAKDKRKGNSQRKVHDINVGSGDSLKGKDGEGGSLKTDYREDLKVVGPSGGLSGQRKPPLGKSPMSPHGAFNQTSSMRHGPIISSYGDPRSDQSTQELDELPRDRKDGYSRNLSRQDTISEIFEKPRKRKKQENNRLPKVIDASADAVKDLLMLHCMRAMKTEDAEDFLYGKDQEITEDQNHQGFAPLEFESILQYVAFPNLQIKKNSPRSQRGTSVKRGGNGRDDMTILFEFLRKKRVKRIVRVIVADRDTNAHSDAAVEHALRSFSVEIWDWQKFDICTETIAHAAPDVEEMDLYWSGNNAFLWGWSDEEVLKRMRELKKIYLHNTQGLEAAHRTQENVTKYKARIAIRCPNVSIELVDETSPQKHEISNTHTNAERELLEIRHRWLIRMDDFADFMRNLQYQSTSYRPVKVAFIDDGVDIFENALHGKVQGGKSFCLRDEQKKLNKSFYLKSGGHGTAMASLICRVCPHATLIALKLDEYLGPNLERQITAKSAAKALQHAIERKADIISMSWTIEKTDENKSDIDALEQAVQDAANKGILMFCAASDGGAQSDRSFPARSLKQKLFKIGAATEEGSKWKWVGNATNVDFIFPGHKVVKERYNEEGPIQSCSFLTGSSVATAIAAGLAALILDCVQRAALYYEELLRQQRTLNSARPPNKRDGSEMTELPRDPELDSRLQRNKAEVDEAIQRAGKVLREDYDTLKGHDKMYEAFRKIGLTEERFVMVWDVFQKAHIEAVGKTPEDKIEILSRTAQRLKGEGFQDQ